MSRPPSIKKDDSLSKIEVIGRDDNTRPAVLPEPTPDEVCSCSEMLDLYVTISNFASNSYGDL